MAVVKRNELGHILPGQVLNPTGRTGKRTPSKYTRAVADAAPPEVVAALVVEAIQCARSNRSWRGMLSIAEFILAYTVGRPVNRSLNASANVDVILRALQTGEYDNIEELFSDAMQSGDGETVDGETVGSE